MNSKKEKWLITIILIISALTLWTNLSQSSQLQNMSNELQNNRSQINQLSNEIRTIRTQISEDLAEDDLVQSHSFDYVDAGDDRVKIQVEALLNQIDKDAVVTMAYRRTLPRDKSDLVLKVPQPEEEWVPLVTYTDNGLSYTAEFVDKKYYSYQFRLQVNGESVIKGAELSTADPAYRYYPQIHGEMRPRSYSSDGEIEYMASLEAYSEIEIDIDEIRCELLYQDEVIDSFDLLNIEGAATKFDDRMTHYSTERSLSHKLSDNDSFGDGDLSYRMKVVLASGDVYEGYWDNY